MIGLKLLVIFIYIDHLHVCLYNAHESETLRGVNNVSVRTIALGLVSCGQYV